MMMADPRHGGNGPVLVAHQADDHSRMHHLQTRRSAVSEVEEEVEHLFLLGRFEEAFDVCHTALEWMAARPSPLPSGIPQRHLNGWSAFPPGQSADQDPGAADRAQRRPGMVTSHAGEKAHAAGARTAASSKDLVAIKDGSVKAHGSAAVERMKREMMEEKQRWSAAAATASTAPTARGLRTGHRRFHDAEEEESVMRMVILLIQILFELKRQSEVTPFVRWFYATDLQDSFHEGNNNVQDVHAIPYQVFLLMINLEISLENFSLARDLVRQYFATPKPSEKGKEKSLELTAQQQITLVELYVVNILLPIKHFSEARMFLHSMQSAMQQQSFQILKKEIDKAEDEDRRRAAISQAKQNSSKVPEPATVIEEEEHEEEITGLRPHASHTYTEDRDAELVEQDEDIIADGDLETGLRREGSDDDVEVKRNRQFYSSSSSSSSSSSDRVGLGGSEGQIVRSSSRVWGLLAHRSSFLSTILALFSGRWQQASLLYYYGTAFASILTLFWFVYSKNERLRNLRDSIVRNLRDLMSSAFSYDRTSLNQPRRRRLG